MEIASKFQEQFSLKSFLIGLAAVGIVIILALGYAMLNAAKTTDALSSRLTSQTVFLEKKVMAALDPEPLNPADAQAPPQAQQDDLQPEVQDQIEESQTDMPEPELGTISELQDIIGNQAQALSPAPMPGMTETVSGGFEVPKRNGNETPFKVYKRPFLVNRGKPALALVVQDFGLSEDISKQVLAQLPSTVSLILSPYARDAERWQKSAREDGHEFWIEMGAQTERFPYADPGPQSFLSNVSFGYNRERLYWLLSRTPGFVGVAGFTDGSLQNNDAMFKNLTGEIFKRGLGYLELNPSHDGTLRDLALSENAPYAESFGPIKDLRADSPQIADLQSRLETQGGGIAVVKPTLKNLEDLRNWIRRMEQDGIQIVPASAIAALSRGS